MAELRAAEGAAGGTRRILGIDPGLTCTGYGVIEGEGRSARPLAWGGITPPEGAGFFDRLRLIHDGLAAVIRDHRPGEMAVEEIFHHRNSRVALGLGHARGAAIIAGLEAGLTPHQYTALQVKKAVVGYGRADKSQVQMMLKAIFRLPEPPEPEDASDALAVALTHFFWNGMLGGGAPGRGRT